MNRSDTTKTLLEKHWDTTKQGSVPKTNATTTGTSVTSLADGSSRNTAEPIAILDESKVEKLTSLSRTTRWRMERRGEFPKRVRLSPGRVGWRQAEIEAWIRSHQAEQRPPKFHHELIKQTRKERRNVPGISR
jgi:prophage regulatory protein